jgi:hypothetical protein
MRLSGAVALATVLLSAASPARAQAINQVGEVNQTQQVVYSSSNNYVLYSPCLAGGPGCNTAGPVPAGTLLLACMWNFYRGFAPPAGSTCPTPTSDVALPIRPPASWKQLDHLEQPDPYGNPKNNNTPGGFDEFYLFYKIADGTEGNSYNFTTTQCPEDQAGVVVGFSGVNPAQPFDPSNGAGGHSFSCSDPPDNPGHCTSTAVGSPVTIPGFTTQSNGDLLWSCIIDGFYVNQLNTPPGYTNDFSWSYFASGTCCDIMAFYQAQVVAGPTGDIVSEIAPVSGAPPLIDNWFGELVALQPEVALGPTPTASPTPITDALTVRPRSVNFGDLVRGIVGESKPASITINNAKGSKRVPIVLGSPSITTSDTNADYQIDPSGSCADGMTLAPSEACTLTLQFSPTALKASKATLTIPNNGNRGRQLTIGLGGRGVRGRLTHKPTSLNFDKVPVGSPSASLSVTLTNGNVVPIAIGPATIAGKEAPEFVSDSSACATSVPANQSCAINVTLTPGKKGARHATLEITTGGTPSVIKVPLRGVGE